MVERAKRAAVAAAVFVADGDDAGANEVLRLYIRDAMAAGELPLVALKMLAAACLNVAAACSDRDALRALAFQLATEEPEAAGS